MAASSVSIYQQYNFVLWDDGFEEEEALLFVTELRERGLRTKLLGVTERHASGRYGVTLACDMMLPKTLSLVAQTSCVVIPGHGHFADVLAERPPLLQFLQSTHAHRARLLTNRAVATADTFAMLPWLEDVVEIYPGLEELVPYAVHLAQSLHEQTPAMLNR